MAEVSYQGLLSVEWSNYEKRLHYDIHFLGGRGSGTEKFLDNCLIPCNFSMMSIFRRK